MILKLISKNEFRNQHPERCFNFVEFPRQFYELSVFESNTIFLGVGSHLIKPEILIVNESTFAVGIDQSVLISRKKDETREFKLMSNFIAFTLIKDSIIVFSELSLLFINASNLECRDKIYFEDLLEDYEVGDGSIEVKLFNGQSYSYKLN